MKRQTTTMLAALFKTCTESKWLGDICRALGGQAVKLDAGQKAMLETIRAAEIEDAERETEKRTKTAERQRRYRARQIPKKGGAK